VTVEIVEVASTSDPRATNVRYAVRNRSDAPVWVVDDGWVTWRRDGRAVELSYARVPMRPGVSPFGYFDPEVVELPPGGELERTVRLTWPQPLSRLWNAEAEADPPPGEYELTVRIGYGATAGARAGRRGAGAGLAARSRQRPGAPDRSGLSAATRGRARP
jgi:hypothetical protein